MKISSPSTTSMNNPLSVSAGDTTRATCRKVYISVQVTKIGEIDTMNERYQALFSLSLRWLDKDIDGAAFDPAKHWNPQIYVENIFQDIIEQNTHTVERLDQSVCLVSENRKIRGYFWERLEIQKFPVDVQELSLVLASKLSLSEVILIQDPQIASQMGADVTNIFVDQQKWHLYNLIDISDKPSYDVKNQANLVSITKYLAFDLEPRTIEKRAPKFVATCYCSRKPGYFIWNAYFLIFLITASPLTIFSMDCKQPQFRLNTSFTILLTSITFKWVVNRSLPAVSYLTSLDKYSIVCIFYICCLCVWHSIVGSFWPRDEACPYIDKYALGAFAFLFLAIHIGLVVWFLWSKRVAREIKKREVEFIERLNSVYLTGNHKNQTLKHILEI